MLFSTLIKTNSEVLEFFLTGDCIIKDMEVPGKLINKDTKEQPEKI